MKKTRRVLAAVTALCLAAGLAGSSDHIWKIRAQQAGCQNAQQWGKQLFESSDHILLSSPESDFQYEDIADGTIKITKYIGSDAIVEIPADISGRSVAVIGSSAFDKRNSMTQLVIPSTVTSIEENAIVRCPSLTDISVDAGSQNYSSVNGVLFNKTQMELVRYPEGKAGAYVIPDSVTSIGNLAYLRCDGLSEVTIPSSVKSIGDSAFWLCANLSQVHMAEGVNVIKSGAFTACTKLADIVLPDSVAEIGTHAFENCTSLTEIAIPDGITTISGYVFSDCTSLASVSLPDSVTSIQDFAFDGCSALKDVHYSGMRSQWEQVAVGQNGNDALQNAQLSCQDTTGYTADYEYRELENGAVMISKYKGTDTDVVFPVELNGKRVQQIGIGIGIFMDNGNVKSVTIPSGVTVLGSAFNDCPNLTAIYTENGNDKYVSKDGVLYNASMTTIVRVPQGKSGSFTIPAGVIKIGDYAFWECRNLTEITMPDGLEEIGESAFHTCVGIKMLRLPESLKIIGFNVFASCRNLEKVNIPSGLAVIRGGAFSHCNKLSDIEISNGVTEIGGGTFVECVSLKSIAIPQSVIKISKDAFGWDDTPSRLEDVYYSGTKEQWEQIEVDGEGSTVKEKLGLDAEIHFKDEPIETPDNDITPAVGDAKQELAALKSGDSLSLEPDFSRYMSAEQIDTIESGLYTWLAQIDYAYRYSGTAKDLVMKKAGINPEGNFASGTEQAVTHISVETKYGPKIFEITLDLGKPDNSGSLYPSFGSMHYEVLDKSSIPPDVPTGGQIGKSSYTDMKPFIESVRSAADDSLRKTYQGQSLDDERTACILIDKTAAEIIGNKNGSFSDCTLTVYAKPLVTYKKIVTITSRADVDVFVYSMDGREVGSIVDNQPASDLKGYRARTNQNVQMNVSGDTKTVYLAGDDYYLKMRGMDTGTMTYEVEEIANDDVRRRVQFLELQLLEDMQYDGYVFRPLNIDRDLYALRVQGGTGQDLVYAGTDSYQSLFKRVEGLSLSRDSTFTITSHTIQLDASLYPADASNPNLQWKTDNASVVTVDGNGLVTAVGAGRATVSVMTKDGSFLRQYCVFDVADGSGGSGNTGGSGGSGSTGGNGSSSGSLGGNGSSSGSGSTGGSNSSNGNPNAGSGTSNGQGKPPVIAKLHFVLQFDVNGGNDLTRRTMTLLTDDSPGILPKARRKDYLFDGWYTQQEGGVQIAGDLPVNKAVTLYAHWTKAEAPKAPSLTLKSKKKGQLQISIQKVSGAAGYQVEISSDKDFTSVKTKKIGSAARAKTVSGLKAGKKYFVRVRSYRLDSARSKIYSAYSGIKSIKVKG